MGTIFDITNQAYRREAIRRLLIEYYYDTFYSYIQRGVFPKERESFAGLRERFWFAHALLHGDHKEHDWIALGNNIIVNSDCSSQTELHFTLIAAVSLLLDCDKELEDDSKKALLSFIEMHASKELPQFVGVNDNYPSMTTAYMMLAGQILNDTSLVERGKDRLTQVEALLSRRGCLSEYNSPTYSVVSLHAFALLSNGAIDANTQAAALRIEKRIWVDILSHLHPKIYKIAGPHSRAYLDSCLAHDTLSSFALYAVLGEKLVINPINTIFAGRGVDPNFYVLLDAQFMRIYGYYVMSANFHCPEELLEFAMNKTYPYETLASAEVAAFPELNVTGESQKVYPGGFGCIKTVMEPDFALGTSDREFASGVSTNSFHILYRKQRLVESQKDVGVVFSRYISNERLPEKENRYDDDYQGVRLPNGGKQLHDAGRKVAFLQSNCAIVIYTPKLICARDTTSLKLSVLFPLHFGLIESVWIGGHEILIKNNELSPSIAEYENPTDVIIKDGRLWFGLRPMAITDLGRKVAIRLERQERYLMVSFFNYEGPMRDFEVDEIYSTSNGFIAQVCNSDKIEDVSVLRNKLLKAELKDEMVRYSRRISYQGNEMAFECEYCPYTESMRYVTINGEVPDHPKFSATGLEHFNY